MEEESEQNKEEKKQEDVQSKKKKRKNNKISSSVIDNSEPNKRLLEIESKVYGEDCSQIPATPKRLCEVSEMTDSINIEKDGCKESQIKGESNKKLNLKDSEKKSKEKVRNCDYLKDYIYFLKNTNNEYP